MMCFSAQASFTAAALLGLCGGLLVNKFKNDRNKILLAMIPLFFGVQQLSEGVLWESFYHNQYGSLWSLIAQHVFMFFAYLFWPVWIPFACLIAEKVEWRKYIIASSLMIGMMFYCYISFLYFTQPLIQPHVVEHSIVYAQGGEFAKMLYVAVVITPLLFSSIAGMWIVGVLTAVSFFIADYVYTHAYASIWCFASAIVFVGLYFVLKPEDDSPGVTPQSH